MQIPASLRNVEAGKPVSSKKSHGMGPVAGFYSAARHAKDVWIASSGIIESQFR